MDMASVAAARVGCRRLTVIIGGANRPARSMFENAARFQRMGCLLAAGTLQPKRAARASSPSLVASADASVAAT